MSRGAWVAVVAVTLLAACALIAWPKRDTQVPCPVSVCGIKVGETGRATATLFDHTEFSGEWNGKWFEGLTLKDARKKYPGESFGAISEKYKHLVGKRVVATNSQGRTRVFRLVDICGNDSAHCRKNLGFQGNGLVLDVLESDNKDRKTGEKFTEGLDTVTNVRVLAEKRTKRTKRRPAGRKPKLSKK